MDAADLDLPKSVHRVALGDRELFLIGTAHVSRKSTEEVEATLAAVRPDTVCVELCQPRLTTLTDRHAWRQLDVFKVIKEGKAPLLLSSLLMTSFQRRIAKELGVTPGEELLAGVHWAQANGATLVLADRDIQTTLRRTFAGLGAWARIKMLTQLLAGLFASPELDAETIEAIKEREEMADMMAALASEFPQVKSTLIDERDTYLAEKIRSAPGERLVAVVGAGHVEGILGQLSESHDLSPLEQLPPPKLWPKVVKWALPLVILALLIYVSVQGGAQKSVESVAIWVLVNGALSGLGAALAFGHPLTVLTAFVAAPFTSLNPMIAAGWVAGLVQAWLVKPRVEDLEDLPEAITTVRGFWRNAVSRVLLVAVLSNLGSSLGTFLAGGWIAARLL